MYLPFQWDRWSPFPTCGKSIWQKWGGENGVVGDVPPRIPVSRLSKGSLLTYVSCHPGDSGIRGRATRIQKAWYCSSTTGLFGLRNLLVHVNFVRGCRIVRQSVVTCTNNQNKRWSEKKWNHPKKHLPKDQNESDIWKVFFGFPDSFVKKSESWLLGEAATKKDLRKTTEASRKKSPNPQWQPNLQ